MRRVTEVQQSLDRSALVEGSASAIVPETAAAEASPSSSPSPISKVGFDYAAERTSEAQASKGYADYNYLSDQSELGVKLALADAAGAQAAPVVSVPPVESRLEKNSFFRGYADYNYWVDQRGLSIQSISTDAPAVRQSERVATSSVAQKPEVERSFQCYAKFDI